MCFQCDQIDEWIKWLKEHGGPEELIKYLENDKDEIAESSFYD